MSEPGKRLVLASQNAGKIAELSALLAPHHWQVEPLCSYTDISVEENAPSYVENALLKARAAAEVSGLPAIADDSGLEVTALGDAPGVHSARYAGDEASDEDNVERLLEALQQVPDERRDARFRCLVVYLRSPDDPAPLIAQAVWPGRILHAPKGHDGFGYDPVFYVPESGCSAAELEPAQKNTLSHRAQAVRALIESLVGSPG